MAGRPIVISGPSGTGKSTLLKMLFKEYPTKFAFSVSNTTRQPRPGEKDGVDYRFVTKPQFETMVANGEFVEHAQFSNNYYGTSFAAIDHCTNELKRTCILDIDMQGVKSVKRTKLNARFVFVEPPSIQDLRKRLEGRGTETKESLERRLGAAQAEMDYAATGAHDKVIVNDDLERAYQELKEFIFSEQV